jgi:hypothetical protein
VQIKNPGPETAGFFVDPRLPVPTRLDVAALDGVAVTTVPERFDSALPQYLVPTHTTAITEHARTDGADPIQIDSSATWGDPNIASDVGTSVTATHSAPTVSQGDWSVLPQSIGPFGEQAAPPEQVLTSMTVTTAAFDPAVSSPTGDLWLNNSSTLDGFHPVFAGPGETATIPVTITPDAPRGTRVRGTIYVDDANLIWEHFLTDVPNGDEVAGMGYAYTVF